MASLYTQQARNVRRTFFLMSVFLIVVIGIAWLVSAALGSPGILWVVAAFAIIINVAAYWKSDAIAIRMTRAQPISRDTHFYYWNSVENLCISIGAPMPKLYIIDDPSPNAFATGRNPKHSAIVVTQGLLDMMDKSELEGVLAHELAHIQNRDTLLMTSVVVLFGMTAILLDIILHAGIAGDRRDMHPAMIAVALAAYIIVPLILTIIRLAISRKREFLADATSGIYTRYPEGLASALEKIGKSTTSMKHASSATAHLFISDPFGISDHAVQKKKKGFGLGIHRLFDTHPPIENRIRVLLGGTSHVENK